MGWLALGLTLIALGLSLGVWVALGQFTTPKPRYRRKGGN